MERKEIIKVLGEHLGVKPKYMGVPTCAYKIETAEGTYIIDRAGKITTSDGNEVELETILQLSVEGIPEPYTQTKVFKQLELSETIEQVSTETTTIEVAVPMEGHTGISLRNLVNIVYSKQVLIKKSLGTTSNIIEDDFCKGINEAKIETLEDFKTASNNTGVDKCQRITFDFNNNTITFKLLEGEVSADKIQAYTQLVTLLNQSAKVLKHASAKSKDTDNDKFTFRVFLVRIGMISDEYKATRKILLENLEGNSAFRSGKKPEKNKVTNAE